MTRGSDAWLNLPTGDVGVGWFPQDLASEFYTLKGLVALTATVMLVHHMNLAWGRLVRHSTRGQRLRYITLLAFSVLVTGASAEQVAEAVEVSYRNLGGFLVTLLLLVTVVISIREEREMISEPPDRAR